MLAKTKIEDIMFDKETIIEWFKSKDPNARYNYCQPATCLFSQFLKDHNINPDEFYDKQGWTKPPGVWHKIAKQYGESWSTYGAALARAKELLK